jgi:hypothetical protein
MHGRGVSKREDRWFSKAIRQRDGACRCCGSTEDGQCAHIYGRATKATRWDPDNAVRLCATCHGRFTGEPVEWGLWCDMELGEEHMDRLKTKKNGILKVTDALRGEVSDHYRMEYNRMVREGSHDLKPWTQGEADNVIQ